MGLKLKGLQKPQYAEMQGPHFCGSQIMLADHMKCLFETSGYLKTLVRHHLLLLIFNFVKLSNDFCLIIIMVNKMFTFDEYGVKS